MASNHIVDVLAANFNKRTFSDFEIKVEGKSIHVHKSHLQMASEYLRTMMSEHWCDKSEVEITDYPYEVVYRYLKYLYTGQIEITENIIEKLYDLANCYLEDDLKACCDKYMRETVNWINLKLFYQLTIKYNAASLKSSLEQSCNQRLREFYPSVLSGNLDELKTKMEVYMQNNVNYYNVTDIWYLTTTYNLSQVKPFVENFFIKDVKSFSNHYLKNRGNWNKENDYGFYYKLALDHQMTNLAHTVASALKNKLSSFVKNNSVSNLTLAEQKQLVNHIIDIENQ